MIQHGLVRAALLPYSAAYENNNVNQHATFLEAVYIASHHLYQKQLDNPDLLPATQRYFFRMCTRPTPFGLFAGCGVARWDQSIQIDLQKAVYHARLDHLVLHQLVQQILQSNTIRNSTRFYPNNSLYQVHDEFRYIEYTLHEHKRKYKLSAVTASDSLENVFECCKKGALLSDISQTLVNQFDVSINEAETYLHELVENQILISELEPAVTGEEYLQRLIHQFKKLRQQKSLISEEHPFTFGRNTHKKSEQDQKEINLEQSLILLEKLECAFKKVRNKTSALRVIGSKIVSLLKPILPNITEHHLFQVDTVLPTFPSYKLDTLNGKDTSSECTDKNIISTQLSEALIILNKLAPPPEQYRLNVFTRQFFERYEEREVPLAEALDAELGIEYITQNQSSLAPLLEDLSSQKSTQEDTIAWTEVQTLNWKLLQKALHQQQYVVNITDEMVAGLKVSEEDLPPSMSIMFRRIEGDQLYLESVGGVSATNLINRFGYAESNIYGLVQDIVEQEQQYNPEVVFAEIVHLPESRVGNIVFHPSSRKYEIPYLATPSVDEEYQLSLSDLYLSIKHDELILRSKKLNKRIIPRLSTAHNYHLSELPVYRFLCDLQSQGLRTHLTFDWGTLAHHFKFLPRVKYKNFILHAATWHLEEEDLSLLKQAGNNDFEHAFRDFCKQWHLPRYWTFADGDHELFVDSENMYTVQAWWDLVKNRKKLVLKEYFSPDPHGVVNKHGRAHAHQIVASWIKQQPTYRGLSECLNYYKEIQRSFVPGSEWLYFKVYCSVTTSDRILEEVIAPLVEILLNEKSIDKWFFIRYADPDHHLRIRFYLTNQQLFGVIVQQIQASLAVFEKVGKLYKIQLDTYHRELERYHGSAVVEAESLFYQDSETVVRFLSLTEGDDREDLRWLWGLRSIDALLDDFHYTISDKLTLLEELKEAFVNEFRMDKSLKVQINKKFRMHRPVISSFLNLKNPEGQYNQLLEILEERSVKNKAVAKRLLLNFERLQINDLLKSYIHMLINRLVPNQQRFHELVIYNFLYRHYHSQIKIAQQKHKI